MAKPKTTDAKSQRQKFIDAAREHGASEDDQTFENALRKIAKAQVGKAKPVKKPAK